MPCKSVWVSFNSNQSCPFVWNDDHVMQKGHFNTCKPEGLLINQLLIIEPFCFAFFRDGLPEM